MNLEQTGDNNIAAPVWTMRKSPLLFERTSDAIVSETLISYREVPRILSKLWTRRISSDQEHVFAHQSSRYQQHGKHLQCENCDFCTYLCPDRNKLNTVGARC